MSSPGRPWRAPPCCTTHASTLTWPCYAARPGVRGIDRSVTELWSATPTRGNDRRGAFAIASVPIVEFDQNDQGCRRHTAQSVLCQEPDTARIVGKQAIAGSDPMRRYYFDMLEGDEIARDDEGLELPDLSKVQEEAPTRWLIWRGTWFGSITTRRSPAVGRGPRRSWACTHGRVHVRS